MMKRTPLPRTAFVAMISALALPLPATAQEAVEANPVVTEETVAVDAAIEGVEVDLIARWLADPGTIFNASEVVLDDLQYVARPLIILANSPNDPMVAEQLGLIAERPNELSARDVIIIIDTDPDAATAVRAQFRPRGFSMLLIGKDGRVALRKPVPWAVREIVHTIDRLPIRQQELRDN